MNVDSSKDTLVRTIESDLQAFGLVPLRERDSVEQQLALIGRECREVFDALRAGRVEKWRVDALLALSGATHHLRLLADDASSTADLATLVQPAGATKLELTSMASVPVWDEELRRFSVLQTVAGAGELLGRAKGFVAAGQWGANAKGGSGRRPKPKTEAIAQACALVPRSDKKRALKAEEILRSKGFDGKAAMVSLEMVKRVRRQQEEKSSE